MIKKVSGDVSDRTSGTSPSLSLCCWSQNIALNTSHLADNMHLCACVVFREGPIRNFTSLKLFGEKIALQMFYPGIQSETYHLRP